MAHLQYHVSMVSCSMKNDVFLSTVFFVSLLESMDFSWGWHLDGICVLDLNGNFMGMHEAVKHVGGNDVKNTWEMSMVKLSTQRIGFLGKNL